MGSKKIKKTSLLFARDEFSDIINDLILLEIMDISKPTFSTDGKEQTSQIKTEVIDISEYDANHESLTLFGTERTLYLTGWISAKSEVALITMASKYTCAWEIEPPTSEELSDAPIILARPNFLYRFYRGHRELFSPLSKKEVDYENDENDLEDEFENDEEPDENTEEADVDETTVEVEIDIEEIIETDDQDENSN